MSAVFWAWVTVAVVLLFAEALAGGLLALPFAIGAVLAALLEVLGAGIGWQWAAFLVVSSVVLVVAQRLMADTSRGPTPATDEGDE